MRENQFDPWVGKIPWRRKWQPTPVFLPGKSHGGRSLVGYSPWGRKELDTTERLHLCLCLTSLHRYIKGSSDQAYPEDIYIYLSLPPSLTKPFTTQNISNTLSSLSDSIWPVTQARSPGASVTSSLHLSHSAPQRTCHLHTWNSSQIHHFSQSLACPPWDNCQHF